MPYPGFSQYQGAIYCIEPAIAALPLEPAACRITSACLQVIDFTGNSMTGTIPESIGNSQKLRFLYLGGNYFTGMQNMYD